MNDVWEVHYLCSVCCLDQDLIWSAGSQEYGTLIDHRDVIAAVFPGHAVTCYEIGLTAFFIFLGVQPLSWMLISVTFKPVLPLGPCHSNFWISPLTRYSVTAVKELVVSTEITSHVLGR